MEKETIVISKKYILIHSEDDYVIVDTGSPLSYHKSGQLSFGGISHECQTSIIGVDGDALSEETGMHVVGLIGMDILNSCHNVLFDYGNAQIIVNDDQWDESNLTPLSSGTKMSIPYIDILIEGKKARVLVDTGAPISYISEAYTNGLPIKDRLHDYNPALGKFLTDVRDAKVEIGTNTHVMPFGNLPSHVHMLLKLMGADGVIGYELFSRYELLYQNRQWYICSGSHLQSFKISLRKE